MVTIGLLQARGRVGTPKWDGTSIEGREAIVRLLGVTVGHNIR